MISRVVASERQRLVPQPSSFTRAQQNGHFTACRVIGFTGGCPNAGPEQWSGHRGGLQIIGCSLFNWNVCGARLAHEAGSRRIFGTRALSAAPSHSWQKARDTLTAEIKRMDIFAGSSLISVGDARREVL